MPGTPTDRPLQRTCSNAGEAVPLAVRNESARIVAGAVSRPSMVVTLPERVRMTMKPPPPIPDENGSVTPSTPAAATVASIALPPRRSVSIAAFVASASTVAAAPPLPVAVGSLTNSVARLGGRRRGERGRHEPGGEKPPLPARHAKPSRFSL